MVLSGPFLFPLGNCFFILDASGGLLIIEPHPWPSQSIQATVIKEHRTGWLINSRNFFLTVLKQGSLRSGCQHSEIAGCWLLTYFSLCPTQWRTKRKLSCDSESTNPNHEGSTPMTSSNPNYLPKAHLLTVSDWRRVSTHVF